MIVAVFAATLPRSLTNTSCSSKQCSRRMLVTAQMLPLKSATPAHRVVVIVAVFTAVHVRGGCRRR